MQSGRRQTGSRIVSTQTRYRRPEGAAAVIDGLWIRWALSDSRPPPDEAAAYAERGIARLIGESIDG